MRRYFPPLKVCNFQLWNFLCRRLTVKLPWPWGNFKTFLPTKTHQLFSTNEPWEGWTEVNGLAHSTGTDASHYFPRSVLEAVTAPGGSLRRSRKSWVYSQQPGGWKARTAWDKRSLIGAHQTRVQTVWLAIKLPSWQSWDRFTTTLKKWTMTTHLQFRAPLATTSDLKRKSDLCPAHPGPPEARRGSSLAQSPRRELRSTNKRQVREGGLKEWRAHAQLGEWPW